MPDEVTIIKRSIHAEELWRYTGVILERHANRVVLEARFNRPDTVYHGVMYKKGDRFVETFYTDRWYNIMQMFDRDDQSLKGWYCNITLPAVVTDSTVEYTDLALDLFVFPDGRQLALDEDEFAALDLTAEQRIKAQAALVELQRLFAAPLGG